MRYLSSTALDRSPIMSLIWTLTPSPRLSGFSSYRERIRMMISLEYHTTFVIEIVLTEPNNKLRNSTIIQHLHKKFVNNHIHPLAALDWSTCGQLGNLITGVCWKHVSTPKYEFNSALSLTLNQLDRLYLSCISFMKTLRIHTKQYQKANTMIISTRERS